MNLLLDTHLLIWSMSEPHLLSKEAKRYIESADNLFVSAASLWEISIKASLGKLEVDLAGLEEELQNLGIQELLVSWRHTVATKALPWHHKDPFDRLLIAQAMSEPLILLSNDKILEKYTDLVKVV